MDNKKFIIKKISAEDTRNLRRLILRPHQKAEELVYPGDEDKETVHFGLYFRNELSGIASIYKNSPANYTEENAWRLRGMATNVNIRGMGLGKELMNECIMYVKNKGGKIFWCNARTTAEKFYEKFGMKRQGEVFYPEGLGEHVVMTMEISETK